MSTWGGEPHDLDTFHTHRLSFSRRLNKMSVELQCLPVTRRWLSERHFQMEPQSNPPHTYLSIT